MGNSLPEDPLWNWCFRTRYEDDAEVQPLSFALSASMSAIERHDWPALPWRPQPPGQAVAPVPERRPSSLGRKKFNPTLCGMLLFFWVWLQVRVKMEIF